MTLLEELAKQRAELIDKRQDNLTTLGVKLQDKLLDALVKKLVEEFETSKGVITFNGKNIRAVDAMRKIFADFIRNENLQFATSFVKDISQITTLNANYFGLLSEDSVTFKTTREQVKKLMAYRLGITSTGEIVPNGFLENFIKDPSLLNKVRDVVLNGVTKQLPMKDLITDLKLNVLGAQGADGAIVKKYNDYLFDVYQQHDRATSSTFAQSLELEAFIYAGGLIDASRPFCQKRNAKVFTVTEAEDWIDDPTLPRTADERKAGKITNYNPVIDCGRWRCRHHVNYILKSLAVRMRPDLKFAA